MEDGVKSTIQPIGMAEGTVISVEHLFQNTPARLAFQRRPETETARIVDVVVDHALAHPSCGFHLKTERRTLLNVPPTEDMMDRLYDIMGAQATDLVPLQQPLMMTKHPEQSAGAVGSARLTSPVARAMTFTCSSTNDPSLQARSSRPYAVATRHGSCRGDIRWRW